MSAHTHPQPHIGLPGDMRRKVNTIFLHFQKKMHPHPKKILKTSAVGGREITACVARRLTVG